MNADQLNNYIRELGIARDHILREEAEMEILSELAKDKLSAGLVFYGGTALRLVYGSPRFSEDIDLIIIKKVLFSEFRKFTDKLLKKHPDWELKDLKDKRRTMFALLLINEGKLKHPFSVKVEVHKPAVKIKLDSELHLIKSPVSIAGPLMLVPPLKELKRLKEEALANRKKARDIFDLWYIAQALREDFVLPGRLPGLSEREFRNELQVFLPKKYYPVIGQLYAQFKRSNK